MNKDEKITRIVKILRDSEDALSDGYGYYCEPDETLRGIAIDILEAIEKE